MCIRSPLNLIRTTPAILVYCTLFIASLSPARADEPAGVIRTFAVLFNSLEPPVLQFESEHSLGLVICPNDGGVPSTHFHFCLGLYDSNDWETQKLLHVTSNGAETIPFTVIWSEAPL